MLRAAKAKPWLSIIMVVATIPIPTTVPIPTVPIVGTVPIPTTIPIPIGMVPIPIPVILCDLHLAVFGRRSPLIIRGFQNSRGVGARLQGERAGVHGPADCIGRHGRLRHSHSRNRTNCRYQTYDCLIHTLLLWVTGSTGSTDITTNVLTPPLSG